jgi:hypothetical protein
MHIRFVASAVSAVLFTLSALETNVYSLPNGAPRCAINPQFIASEHKIRQDTLITATTPTTYTPGGAAIPLSVTSSKGKGSFMGLLSYVLVGNVTVSSAFPAGSTGLNPMAPTNQHVGVFSLENTANLRAQTASLCTQGKVVNQDPLSTLTHASPMNIQGAMNLMWTPPV